VSVVRIHPGALGLVAYFAYGANMAESVMAKHCPGHVAIGTAELPGHRFAFSRRSVRTGTGVADVVADPDSSVWGVLYEVENLATLDAKEGAGWAYDRCPVTVLVEGEPREAITYKVQRPEPVEVPPSRDYVAGILAAARERGLPDAYIAELRGISERAGSASSSQPPS
jgi:AIG2-like family